MKLIVCGEIIRGIHHVRLSEIARGVFSDNARMPIVTVDDALPQRSRSYRGPLLNDAQSAPLRQRDDGRTNVFRDYSDRMQCPMVFSICSL
jgi:hypothetical protein